MNILGVIGSLNADSRTAHLVDFVLAACAAQGAEVETLDLRRTHLPLYDPNVNYRADDLVASVRARVLRAEGFVIGSPEYHGSMTGVTKNFFDHLYHEFSGKCFALVGSVGGGNGVSCFTHMRASVQFCHGWTLPYHVGVVSNDITAEGPTDQRSRDRLSRLGKDLVVYSGLLKAQFNRDLPLEGTDSGFAGFHRRALLGS